VRIVLAIGAILLFVCGLFTLGHIVSDIQVIVAVLCFGFSFSVLGLAAIVDRLNRASQP
jgi:hypothetical protein